MSTDTIAILLSATAIVGTLIALIFKIGQQNQKLNALGETVTELKIEQISTAKAVAFIQGRLKFPSERAED